MKYKNMAILTDVTKCIGCEKCVDACQEANSLPKEKPWRWLKKITDLSSSRWTTIRRIDHEKGDRFVRRQCRHCLEPACVEACIVGALKKSDQGAVIYDRDICIGCRYCMIVCPWEIPRYSWEDPIPYIQKCDLCYERVTAEGKMPACIEACPTKATIFGERDEMLAEARKRLTSEPQKYIQRIWGEKEVGGTSVMYVSDVDLNLTDLKTPISDKLPMPVRTFKILHYMPAVFVGMAAVMGGVHFIIDRRQKLMEAEQSSTGQDTDGPGTDEHVHDETNPAEPQPDQQQKE
ncbi:4Fe-4S dicluster domain-containing protein [candidate division CSSED10-310 bacterium]|uniref:4Fe-4S dicluster domain-containing protein n=1 Tax=candidate division CSSED10-310 bacterium TaxID=2855610 RepID=A0ABV6Z108_UNCC1